MSIRFSPGLLPTLLVCLLLPILISLGFWQLDRAEQKRTLLRQYAQRRQEPPLALTALLQTVNNATDLAKLRYVRIQLVGHYDNTHHIFLDNRMFKHRVGYHLLTPFIVEPQYRKTGNAMRQQTAIVLVNRGWVPLGRSRAVLPEVPDIMGKQVVSGRLYVTPGKTFLLGNALEFRPPHSVIIEALQYKQLAQWLGQTIYPFVLLLDPKAPGGFVRDWHPVLRMTPQRHISYAFQWFGLAVTLLIIFFSVNIRVIPTTQRDDDPANETKKPK